MPKIKRPDGATIHYEVLGEGDPVICLGGWGTFCHGENRGLPFGLVDNFQTIIMDYRGLAESTDNPATPATISMYADDAIAVLDALELENVHLLGMVGIGACICQQIAIDRPDLARSLVNTGAWARADRLLTDQLNMFLEVHRDISWEAFQRLVCAMSFEPEFYNANIDRLLGKEGPWKELRGNVNAHARFIESSLIHDVLDQLKSVTVPALVLHAELDMVTGPRMTKPIEDALPNARGIAYADAAHVLAGKELRKRFSDHLFDFYAET